MNGISLWRFSAGLAVLIAVGLLWGCAQEVGDIDRTQPDKIDKSLFTTDDEWYMQQTVIDTGMEGQNIGDGSFGTAPATYPAFVAFEGALKRIRWTVTENILYAHSTVELADELLDGFEDEDSRREGVVAAFPITQHFDVQRQYSASTGEPSNVIMEDASDRPWYERDYMRVDWSTNLVDGLLMFQGSFGRLSPASHDIPQEDGEAHPNRTRISEEFIDTVTDYHFEPDPFACVNAFGLDTQMYCEAGRLSVRTSMKRVPEEQTYEPLNYLDTQEITADGTPSGEPLLSTSIFDRELGYSVEVECNDQVRDWMLNDRGRHYEARCGKTKFDFFDRFGYFRTERVEWDRYAGGVDDNRLYYANRWNIWQTMFDDEGERLPEEDRTPKPITFHLNVDYPKFMLDAAQRTAEEWDHLFRDTVALAMDIDHDTLDSILEEEYGHTEMFRIEQNSCHPGPLVEWHQEYGEMRADDRGSADDIFTDYIGSTTDPEVMEAALWDLPNASRSELCGELEYATESRADRDARFSWERLGDIRYSFFSWLEESVPWAGYGPSAADPKTGEIIRANANYAGLHLRTTATYAADLIQYFNGELSEDDIMHGVQIRDELFNNSLDSERFGLSPEAQRELTMRAGVDPNEASPTSFEERPAVEDLDPFLLEFGPERIQDEADKLVSHSAKSSELDERRMEFMENPRVKNMMLSDMESKMAVEALARQRYGNDFSDEQHHQAYLDMHSPGAFESRMERRDTLLSERNILPLDGIEQALETLVTYQGAVDYFAGKDRADIKEYFMNEVFIGTQLHEIGHAVGLRHNFSAHADALNYHDEYWDIERAVVEGRISRDDAYSLQGDMVEEILEDSDAPYLSQAEYKIASVMDYTADMTGRMAGLGKYDEAAIKFAYGEMVQQWSDDVSLPNTLDFDTMLGNYRELPTIFADEYAGQEDAYTIGIDIIQNGREYVPIKEAMEQRRQGILSNTANWANYDFDQNNQPALDRTVDYNFCPDRYNGQILDCLTWAYGADQREMVGHAFDSFRAFQIFWRYRRHNIAADFSNLATFQTRLIRAVQTTQNPFRYYSIYRWFDLGIFTDDLQQASMEGFNFFGELLAMPEPGRYCPYDENNSNIDAHWYFNLENTYVPARFHVDDGQCENYVDVDRGEGFLYNYGFSSGTNFRIDRVGTYIDKLLASILLFDMSAEFAQSAFFTDQRATNLSYWSLFQDEMLEMMSGVILGDYSQYGAAVNGGKIEHPKTVDPSTFGLGVDGTHEESPRLFSPQSHNHELQMLANGLIANSSWLDREVDFTHYVKIATTDDEWQDFSEGVDIVEFEHPVTHQIYRAADIEERTIGARLINRANELTDRFIEADEILNSVEPGTGQYQQWNTERDRRLEQLQDVVAKMDLVRDAIELTYAQR